jgi:hypothetical protein
MGIPVSLYLRDQVIQGELSGEAGRRPVDLLNAATRGMLALAGASSRSLHLAEAPPVELGDVQVQRAQALLVIPVEAPQLGLRVMRTGYVERRPRRAHLGLGPFRLSATLHFGFREAPSIDAFVHDASGRFFIPVTDASVTLQSPPAWSLDAPLVFVNRAAVDYGALFPVGTS